MTHERYTQRGLRKLHAEGVTSAMVVATVGGSVGTCHIMTTVEEIASSLDAWGDKDDVVGYLENGMLVLVSD